MAKNSVRGKVTRINREKLCKAVMQAADAAGKQFGENGLVSYLEAQAVATPSPFLTLLGKVISDEREVEAPRVTRIEIVAPEIAPANEAKSGITQEENNQESQKKNGGRKA